MPPAKKSAAKKAPAKKAAAKKAPAKKSAGKIEKKEKVKRAPSAYNLFMKSELAKVKKVCDHPVPQSRTPWIGVGGRPRHRCETHALLRRAARFASAWGSRQFLEGHIMFFPVWNRLDHPF